MDAYTITYVTYGGDTPVFAIVAPNNGMPMGMPGMPMAPMAMPMNPMGLQVPFGQFAMPPMGAMPMPNVSWPIYADFNSVQCLPDMDVSGYSPNDLDSKVEIVEDEPEPEDGGHEASQKLGLTANQTDKTSEMMQRLAEKLEKDKELGRKVEKDLWSSEEDSEFQLATGTGAEKDKIEVDRDAEKSTNLEQASLEILSLIQGNPRRLVRKAGSEAGESCGRMTTESVVSSVVSSPRRRDRRGKQHGQKRFCCNFLLKFTPGIVPMIIGKGGQNTKDIYCKTGCKIRVRGRGSGHLEQGTSEEAPTPLMLAVTAEPNNKPGFVKAVELSLELLTNLEERSWLEQEWFDFSISFEDEVLQQELEDKLGYNFKQRVWSKKDRRREW